MANFGRFSNVFRTFSDAFRTFSDAFRTLFDEVTASFRPSQDRPNQASTEPEKKMSEKKIFGPKARKFFSIPALSNPWGVWGAKPPRKLTNERPKSYDRKCMQILLETAITAKNTE